MKILASLTPVRSSMAQKSVAAVNALNVDSAFLHKRWRYSTSSSDQVLPNHLAARRFSWAFVRHARVAR
jgi:hypothetical protein